MLKRISIQNFKGIGSRIDIDLRPVTLLFGPNSAGKSTMLHAIHYAHALLESGDPDVGRTRLGGDIDLGGFKHLVHDHDLESEVLLGFRLELSIDDLAYFFDGAEDEYDQREMLDELNEQRRSGIPTAPLDASMFAGIADVPLVWSLDVEIRVCWSPYLKRPIVNRFTVRWWDKPFAEVGASLDGAKSWVTNVNLSHPILRDYGSEQEAAIDEISDRLACNYGRANALPRHRLYIEDTDAVGGLQIARKLDDYLHKAASILQGKLERLLYVGPLRLAVPRHYQPPKNPVRSRWANGLGAWDALVRNENLRANTNIWLAEEKHFGTGYQIGWRHYRELDAETFYRMQLAAQNLELDESFSSMANQLPKQGRLVVLDETKNLELAPCDLGEGISQVVPVIAAALANTVTTPSGHEEKTELVAIEQPELHIHPRMQVVLGDLFLSQCSERQFLIETHSEHLMLRLLRRVRETTEGELPADAPTASIDTVAVYYVEQDDGAVKLSELRLSEDGDFKDQWPEGFFGERRQELF
jgi:hypothetical protein